jgi:hypothetical protein
VAAHFLSTLCLVESQRIGYVADCASAQYMRSMRSHEAPGSRRLPALPAGITTQRPLPRATEGRRSNGVSASQGKIPRHSAALSCAPTRPLTHQAKSGRLYFELDYYANSFRGAVASWKNEMAPMSWLHWLTFDGLSIAASNNVPSLMVHGRAVPTGQRQEYLRALGGPEAAGVERWQSNRFLRPARAGRHLVQGVIWRTRRESRRRPEPCC